MALSGQYLRWHQNAYQLAVCTVALGTIIFILQPCLFSRLNACMILMNAELTNNIILLQEKIIKKQKQKTCGIKLQLSWCF